MRPCVHAQILAQVTGRYLVLTFPTIEQKFGGNDEINLEHVDLEHLILPCTSCVN